VSSWSTFEVEGDVSLSGSIVGEGSVSRAGGSSYGSEDCSGNFEDDGCFWITWDQNIGIGGWGYDVEVWIWADCDD
jgi:hypothetical protein